MFVFSQCVITCALELFDFSAAFFFSSCWNGCALGYWCIVSVTWWNIKFSFPLGHWKWRDKLIYDFYVTDHEFVFTFFSLVLSYLSLSVAYRNKGSERESNRDLWLDVQVKKEDMNPSTCMQNIFYWPYLLTIYFYRLECKALASSCRIRQAVFGMAFLTKRGNMLHALN